MEDYCSRPHAMVSFAGDLNGYIDEELALHGCKRKVVLAVPQFNGLASLLAGTDIIATVPDYAAAALAANGGVRAEPPLPFQTSQDFELSMAWRGAQDNDPPNAGCARVSRCSSATRIVCRVENGAAYSTRKRPYTAASFHCPAPAASLIAGLALD